MLRFGTTALTLMAIIVLIFFLWQESVYDFSYQFIHSDYSRVSIGLVIFLLLALDVVLPTPSSLLSLTAALYFGLIGGALVIFLGMSTGCLIGYYLGRSVNGIVNKSALLNEKDELRMTDWSYRWGLWSLVFARPVPVLAETSVIMAGINALSLRTFLIYTIPANALIALVYGMTTII